MTVFSRWRAGHLATQDSFFKSCGFSRPLERPSSRNFKRQKLPYKALWITGHGSSLAPRIALTFDGIVILGHRGAVEQDGDFGSDAQHVRPQLGIKKEHFLGGVHRAGARRCIPQVVNLGDIILWDPDRLIPLPQLRVVLGNLSQFTSVSSAILGDQQHSFASGNALSALHVGP